jgi:hypothetical protein
MMMMIHTLPRPSRIAAVLLTGWLCLSALSVSADSGTRMPRDELKLYKEECGACHLAYPPGFLPAASWQRLMGSLDKHYGDDASLDAASVRQISTWLQVHAGTYKRVAATPPPEDRITRSAWFERKHRKIDTPQVWRHASVKSAANCTACHTTANQGDFEEHRLQFPKGLDARFRAAFSD